MTHLNWEAARRRSIPLEIDVDPLPSSGSWADRRRYYAESNGREQRSARLCSVVRAMGQDFAQLVTYSQHIAHRDFQRKGQVQQKELLSILQRLVVRCASWDSWLAEGQCQQLELARQLLLQRGAVSGNRSFQ